MARGPSPISADAPATVPVSPTHPASLPALKRDGNKRWNQISDRITDFSTQFNSNLRQHYDAQASAIQVDMSLILQTNPYDCPLPDDEESIVKTVYEDFLGGKSVVDPSAESDFVSTVGKWYQQFVRDVNRKMEERDTKLAMLTRKFETQQTEYDQQYQFKVRMAEEEYRILANTVRERLVQQITQKQQRLMREKEMLDLNDSNSFLLHPNQYSIAHPASPGGAQNPRKTRHARHRVVDQDDPPAVTDIKRKRKLNFDSDSGSPNPPSRLPPNINSPFKDAQKRLAYSQYQSSAYSIDRLFTEKELNMIMNHAAVAATDYLVKLKKHAVDDSTGNSRQNGQSDSGPDDGNDDDAAAPLELEPTFSHTTRATLRNSLLDLNSLNDRLPPFAIPKYIPVLSGVKANGAAPSPTPLSQTEIDQDFLIMAHPGDSLDDPELNRLLDAACTPAQVTEYQFRSVGAAEVSGPDEPVSRNSPMPSTMSFMPSSIDLFHPTVGAFPSNQLDDASTATTAGILTSLSMSREGLLASIAGNLAAASRQSSSQAIGGDGGRGGPSSHHLHTNGNGVNGTTEGNVSLKRTASSQPRRTRS